MVMVGAAAIAVVIVLVIMMRSGDDESTTDKGRDTTTETPDTTTPRSVTPANASSGSAKAGKTPATPAPALTHETLGKLDELFAQAKKHYNVGVTKRRAGDNRGARAAQAEAKILLEQWEELIRPQLLWQEEADMEDWAQPAEYGLLTRKYAPFSSLQNMVRKGGGK